MRLCPFLLVAASLLVSTAALAQTSDLALSIEGSVDQAPVGRPVTYDYTVINNGPDATASFTLVTTIPAGEEPLNPSPGANISGNTVTFSGGPLAAGASTSYQIPVRVTAGGVLVNSASVTGTSTDPDTANNTAQYSITAVGGGPVVTLAANVPSVVCNSGEPGEFTLTLSAAQTNDLLVGYTVKGSATPGTDYVLLKGTAKLKAGKTTKIIKVTPEGDVGGAVKKTVVLELNDGDGYTVGTTGKVKVKILAPAN